MLIIKLIASIGMYHIIRHQLPKKLNCLKQIRSKTPTELQYTERSILMKQVNRKSFRNLELGSQEGINVPLWIFVGFQKMDRQYSQTLNGDTFYRPPVARAHIVIGTERYPDKCFLLNFDDDDFSQGYGQIREAFKA